MCWRPAKAIRCANSSKRRSPISAGPSSGAAAASRRRASIDATGEVLVEVDPRYFRPTEVDALLGDPSKASAKLGWRHKTSFDALVKEMVEADMIAIRNEQRPPQSRRLSGDTVKVDVMHAKIFDLTAKRVYVAGHRGMVGSAIVRRLATSAAT